MLGSLNAHQAFPSCFAQFCTPKLKFLCGILLPKVLSLKMFITLRRFLLVLHPLETRYFRGKGQKLLNQMMYLRQKFQSETVLLCPPPPCCQSNLTSDPAMSPHVSITTPWPLCQGWGAPCFFSIFLFKDQGLL